jgi:hypothetical protein
MNRSNMMRMLLLVGAESYCSQDPGAMRNRGRIDEDELERRRKMRNLTVSRDGVQLIGNDHWRRDTSACCDPQSVGVRLCNSLRREAEIIGTRYI